MHLSKEFVTGIAESVTGLRGPEALRQFAKQIAIGASRKQGSESLTDVFSRELVTVFGNKNLLASIAFASDADRYRWIFDQSKPEGNAWEKVGCDGLALIAIDADARFLFVSATESAMLIREGGGIISRRVDHDDLRRWEMQWAELQKQFSGDGT